MRATARRCGRTPSDAPRGRVRGSLRRRSGRSRWGAGIPHHAPAAERSLLEVCGSRPARAHEWVSRALAHSRATDEELLHALQDLVARGSIELLGPRALGDRVVEAPAFATQRIVRNAQTLAEESC